MGLMRSLFIIIAVTSIAGAGCGKRNESAGDIVKFLRAANTNSSLTTTSFVAASGCAITDTGTTKTVSCTLSTDVSVACAGTTYTAKSTSSFSNAIVGTTGSVVYSGTVTGGTLSGTLECGVVFDGFAFSSCKGACVYNGSSIDCKDIESAASDPSNSCG